METIREFTAVVDGSTITLTPAKPGDSDLGNISTIVLNFSSTPTKFWTDNSPSFRVRITRHTK